MTVNRIRVACNVTVSGGAAQSFYSSALQNGGFIESVVIAKPNASGIGASANVTIVCENSSQVILNCTATGATGGGITLYTPRNILTNTVNAPVGPATGAGMALGFVDRIPVGAGERIKTTFSSAGAASAGGKSANVDFYLSGN